VGSIHVSSPRTFCDGAAGETHACSYLVDRGRTVTLTAIAEGLSTFSGWSGACTGLGPCTVTMSEARRVRATFDGPRRLTLIFRSIRFGSGNVVVTPRHETCDAGATCTFLYRRGEPVGSRPFRWIRRRCPAGRSSPGTKGRSASGSTAIAPS
jgi:hypothetical protein